MDRVSRRRVVPGCCTQAPPPSLHEPITLLSKGKETKLSGTPPKPSFKVEFSGVTKSGWKRRSCMKYGGAFLVNQSLEMMYSSVPAGGRFVPSKSAGREAK